MVDTCSHTHQTHPFSGWHGNDPLLSWCGKMVTPFIQFQGNFGVKCKRFFSSLFPTIMQITTEEDVCLLCVEVEGFFNFLYRAVHILHTHMRLMMKRGIVFSLTNHFLAIEIV
jgi:hypothetical protein